MFALTLLIRTITPFTPKHLSHSFQCHTPSPQHHPTPFTFMLKQKHTSPSDPTWSSNLTDTFFFFLNQTPFNLSLRPSSAGHLHTALITYFQQFKQNIKISSPAPWNLCMVLTRHFSLPSNKPLFVIHLFQVCLTLYL